MAARSTIVESLREQEGDRPAERAETAALIKRARASTRRLDSEGMALLRVLVSENMRDEAASVEAALRRGRSR